MSDPIKRFASDHPDHFFLNGAQPEALDAHLRRAGFLLVDERVESCSVAGEGNMNLTLRVQTSKRSFIVKQARPWVEKYPQFEAPWERVIRESEFYVRIQQAPNIAAMMPTWLGCDAAHHLLLLEDLGDRGDYRSVYHGERWSQTDLSSLAQYLSTLHRLPKTNVFDNQAMRALNHAHLFEIPLQRGNGLDLDAIQPGLKEVAEFLFADRTFAHAVADLGQRAYLADGPCLIHGDFFPGSILKTATRPKVIDPEFAFFGRAEFDTSVFVAHLHLARQAAAAPHFLAAYERTKGYDTRLHDQLVGVEIMRRLIGYAQLDLQLSLSEIQQLLNISHTLVLTP